jgi:hypothetical protein
MSEEKQEAVDQVKSSTFKMHESEKVFHIEVEDSAGNQVFSDTFAYLDDEKACDLATRIADELGMEEDKIAPPLMVGDTVLFSNQDQHRIFLKLWDLFGRLPNQKKKEAVKYAKYLVDRFTMSDELALFELERWSKASALQIPMAELKRCVSDVRNGTAEQAVTAGERREKLKQEFGGGKNA